MTADKNPHAVELGRLGGKAGTGKAKARRLTKKRARAMVKARWKNYWTKIEAGTDSSENECIHGIPMNVFCDKCER